MLPHLLLAIAVAAGSSSVTIPSETDLSIRLTSKVGSKTSKVNDAVESVVIAPVAANGKILLPAGAKVRGKVKEVKPCSQDNPRASLDIEFSELEAGGKKTKIAAKLTAVDNARESVDQSGKVVGIVGSETISARMDAGISKVAERYSGLADFLHTAKGAVLKESDPDIAYGSGVEMTVQLTKEAKLDIDPSKQAPQVASIEPADDVARLAVSIPFQTTAVSPPKPSDMTNLMYIGSEQALTKAFTEAGWSTSAALSSQSKLETFRAIAESRGYKEAPMSVLLLEGQQPTLTFEKQNNTFAARHHLRIWKRSETFQGKTVWVCAATHDIGIEFSPENRTFIHKIDSNIDKERAKVVSDLVFTGLVKGLALAERPEVPKKSMNATGDQLLTDGSMAVLLLE